MEDELKEIKEKLEAFAKKYNVTLEIGMSEIGRSLNGELVSPRVFIQMRRQ